MTKQKRRGRPPHDDLLTPAEWRVAHAARHGLTNRAIARRLGVSIDAVKYHVGNVLAKLGISSKRALRSWFAVPAGSALQDREETMNRPLQLGIIGQVSRTVSDIRRAEEWYGGVLGLRHLYSFGTLAFYDCGGTRLFLSQDENPPAHESILYLSVDDIRRAQAELAARGVEFTHAPHLVHTHEDGTEEWMAFFNDPEGRPLALMSRPRPRNDARDSAHARRA